MPNECRREEGRKNKVKKRTARFLLLVSHFLHFQFLLLLLGFQELLEPLLSLRLLALVLHHFEVEQFVVFFSQVRLTRDLLVRYIQLGPNGETMILLRQENDGECFTLSVLNILDIASPRRCADGAKKRRRCLEFSSTAYIVTVFPNRDLLVCFSQVFLSVLRERNTMAVTRKTFRDKIFVPYFANFLFLSSYFLSALPV